MQVVTVQYRAHHLVQSYLVVLRYRIGIAIEAEQYQLAGRCGHIIAVAAYGTAQLHVLIVWYLSVGLDDNLGCTYQRL